MKNEDENELFYYLQQELMTLKNQIIQIEKEIEKRNLRKKNILVTLDTLDLLKTQGDKLISGGDSVFLIAKQIEEQVYTDIGSNFMAKMDVSFSKEILNKNLEVIKEELTRLNELRFEIIQKINQIQMSLYNSYDDKENDNNKK